MIILTDTIDITNPDQVIAQFQYYIDWAFAAAAKTLSYLAGVVLLISLFKKDS